MFVKIFVTHYIRTLLPTLAELTQLLELKSSSSRFTIRSNYHPNLLIAAITTPAASVSPAASAPSTTTATPAANATITTTAAAVTFSTDSYSKENRTFF